VKVAHVEKKIAPSRKVLVIL